MFNRDALFGKKDEPPRPEARGPVNVTPGLAAQGAAPMRPQSQAQPQTMDLPRPDLRFAEPPKTPARAEEPVGSRLIVGPDIKLRGVEITDCDTLVVEGRVEASMDSRVVQIAETGVFAGTVSIDVAEIRGRFEGELTARKHLVIYSTGRVTGRIRYGKIRIEEGGEISGEVSTLQTAVTPTVTIAAAPLRPPQVPTVEETALETAISHEVVPSPTPPAPPIYGNRPGKNQGRPGAGLGKA